ncbi:MAG: CrcB family protein [Flavobacteriales bacterium]
MMHWLAVFLGGGIGSVLRFGVSRVVKLMVPDALFPWATLISNLLATALLAWFVLRLHVHQPGREHWQALFAIGLCGGFSTMSTFSMENHQLLRDGLHGFAVANVLITVTAGVALFHLFARST